MSLFIKNVLFALLVPGTVGIYLPLAISSRMAVAATPWILLALPLLAAGAAILVWCIADFGTKGQGTPFPLDPPRKLVVRGLYRYTRNPMYVGVLLMILGWAALYRNATMLLYAAIVAPAVHLFVILHEEPHLRRTFGQDYATYCQQVRRWF